MYTVVKLIVVGLCLVGILYLVMVNKKYSNDTVGRESIIKYFQEQGAVSVESGIKIRELPIEIAKSNYLLLMVKDETLIFKKGKYYLNREEK